MKRAEIVLLSFLLTTVGASTAQADDMSGMDMKKPMPMTMDKKTDKAKVMTYTGSGIVKSVDKAKGTVTLAHGPIVALHWPAMTMSFNVKDASLFDRLTVGKQVDFTFNEESGGYVVISVK